MQTKKIQMCELSQHKCKQENVLPFFAPSLVLPFLLAFALQTKAQMQVEKPCWNPECRNAHTFFIVLAFALDVKTWACACVSVLCVNLP